MPSISAAPATFKAPPTFASPAMSAAAAFKPSAVKELLASTSKPFAAVILPEEVISPTLLMLPFWSTTKSPPAAESLPFLLTKNTSSPLLLTEILPFLLTVNAPPAAENEPSEALTLNLSPMFTSPSTSIAPSISRLPLMLRFLPTVTSPVVSTLANLAATSPLVKAPSKACKFSATLFVAVIAL